MSLRRSPAVSNRFRKVYETLPEFEHADWNKLTTVTGTFPTVETQVPARYLVAAGRANAMAR